MTASSDSSPSTGIPMPDVAAVVTAMTDAEAPYLRHTMESVLGDPGIGQVVVCITQGNDWAEESLAELLADPRLELLRLPMCPVSMARNRGIERVQLPWTALCDGDDTWCRGKTAAQRAVAERTGCDFVGADHFLADDHGNIRAFGLARYIPMPSSWLVRTEVIRRHPFTEGLADEHEDSRWWRATTGIVHRVRCPRMLIRYRVRSASLSSSAPSKRRKSRIVSLACKPVIGRAVLVCTAALWLVNRRSRYLWHRDWEPAGAKDHGAGTPR